MSSIRRTTTLVAALTVALGLSGCAVTGTNFQPGVAVQVGDQRFSTDEVDAITTDFCAAFLSAAPGEQAFALKDLRSQVAQSLLVRAAAEQVADDEGIEPGPEYEAELAELQTQTADLPEEQQDAVLRVQGSQSYVTSILQSSGEQPLLDVLRTDAEVNPVYDITIDETGAPTVGSADVSTGFGDIAVTAGQDEVDPSYVAGLPASQRCG